MLSLLPSTSLSLDKPVTYHPLPTPLSQKPERSNAQVVKDFAGEVLSVLVDPLAEALTANPFEDEDDPDNPSHADSSLLRELTRSSWGELLLQGGQFKYLLQSLEDHVKRQEQLILSEDRPQRLIRDA